MVGINAWNEASWMGMEGWWGERGESRWAIFEIIQAITNWKGLQRVGRNPRSVGLDESIVSHQFGWDINYFRFPFWIFKFQKQSSPALKSQLVKSRVWENKIFSALGTSLSVTVLSCLIEILHTIHFFFPPFVSRCSWNPKSKLARFPPYFFFQLGHFPIQLTPK